ncbi:MAG: GntR family transcriptional regulator, partial [Spirochaetota bacterium]
DAKDAALLQLPEHDPKLFRLVRIRRVNGEPVLLETTHIPHYLCPELLSADLEHDSLYRVLRDEYHLVLHDAEESYEAALIRPAEAELLECTRKQAVFHIQRIANLEDGHPFEITRSVGRGDYMQFTLHLVSNQTEFRRRVEVQKEE